MKKSVFVLTLSLFLVMLAGCSPYLFLSASQKLEQEADTLLAADRTSEALLAYHQAIQTDTSNHSAIKKLIPLYQQQGRIREAEDLFKTLSDQERSSLDTRGFDTLPKESNRLTLSWIKRPIQDVPVGLAADADMAAVTYQSGKVVLIRLSDGTPVWSITLGETITSAPTLAPGFVLAGCESGNLIALDRRNGAVLWKTTLPGSIYARPFVDQDRVYAGSYQGKMTALDLSSGRTIWQMDAGDPILSQPVLVNNTLFFGTTGGTIFSIDRKTGVSLWEKPARLSGSIEASPVVTDDLLLIASNDSRLYALDLNGREYYWQYSTSDSLYASPLVQQDRVFVFSIGQVAAALDLSSGNAVWEQDLPVPVRSTPVLSGDKLYFAGVSEPYLFEMDAATGELTDKINTGDWIEAGPILVEKTLLLAGKDGAVIAYHLN